MATANHIIDLHPLQQIKGVFYKRQGLHHRGFYMLVAGQWFWLGLTSRQNCYSKQQIKRLRQRASSIKHMAEVSV